MLVSDGAGGQKCDTRIVKRCAQSQSLLDFVYDLGTNSYRIDKYSQSEYIEKIRTGKGDPQVFSNSNSFIDLGKILGETTPQATADEPLQITKTNFDQYGSVGKPVGWN